MARALAKALTAGGVWLAVGSACPVGALAQPAAATAAAQDFHGEALAAYGRRDPAQAVVLARQGATSGDPKSRLLLAHFLMRGVGGPRDSAGARALAGEAADAGLADAEYLFGDLLRRGVGGAVDLERSALYLERAALKGHADASFSLAVVLRNKAFARHDEARAFDWALLAADARHPAAQGLVGSMILNGQSVARDAEKAVAWLRRGVELGDAQSMANLGWAMVTGNGIARDLVEGEQLMVDAARRGSRESMRSLALMYKSGNALPRDYGRAYAWANIAVASGNAADDVRKLRDELEPQLSADQRTAAQRSARDFKFLPDIASRAEPPIPGTAPAAAALPVAATAGPRVLGSGTGFFVSAEGHLVTNQHVVARCGSVGTPDHGKAEILHQDAGTDLAILRTARPAAAHAGFRRTPVVLGEAVYAFGFPLRPLLASSGNFTSGLVSSLAGAGNDASRFQITAPIQPGNSGGPLMDEQGRVVGVVVASLSAGPLAVAIGMAPQNVNFAVQGPLTQAVLAQRGVKPVVASESRRLAAAQVAERAKAVSTPVLCYQ